MSPPFAARMDDPMLGRTLEGRYTILARIGAGSMGAVYRAKQHAMGRQVAIKILRGDRAVDDTAKARFLREARANSLLASPNTVTVFDFGESEDGEFYLAMELLEGESLGQRLSRVGRLAIPVAVDAARQALRSLSEAHAKGIIHRDLKPDNLFFARVLTGSVSGDHHEEIVKVLDFGIAKMLRDEDEPMGVVETQAGMVFGTPRYMSPEQAQGNPLDARTDLYSLGVIVYQMLSGQPPFNDKDAVVAMARHIKTPPRRPNEVNPEANIPKALEDVVMRALSKDPAQRQANADVFAGELLAALEARDATTSGARAPTASAARPRFPESMRPSPAAHPTAQSRTRFAVGARTVVLVAMVPLLVLMAAAGSFVARVSRKHPPPRAEHPMTALSLAPATAAGSTPESPTLATPPTVIASEDPPKAQPPVAPKAPPQHMKRTGRPKGVTSTAHPETATPPATASTSNYGVFE